MLMLICYSPEEYHYPFRLETRVGYGIEQTSEEETFSTVQSPRNCGFLAICLAW
jgi:hypothetical protein